MELNRKNMQRLALLIAFAVLLFVGLENFSNVTGVLGQLFRLVAPFLLGGCIAFILNVPMAFIERKLFKKPSKYKRPLSIVLAVLLVAGLITVAVLLVAPQIGRSIQAIGAAFPGFYADVQLFLANAAEKLPLLEDALSGLQINWNQIDWKMVGETAMRFINGTGDLLGSTFNMASSVLSSLVNFVLGLFFAIYVLAQKEKLGRQMKKLAYALLPERAADKALSVCSLAHTTFANFITGQCAEACILGLMFFISMTLLRFPFALLVGVLIGITALIPIFGAFIGCALGAFFILIESPVQAFWFIVLFLAIQQIEGNFIYPHVVGSSVGLPSIWVLVAVSVGGAAMGIIGMLIFIPLLSVIYTLLRGFTNETLARRGVSPTKWGDRPRRRQRGGGTE